MALWAISWVMQWFLLSTILQGILLLLLVLSNMALLIYHPPVSSRPLDTALIHAPLRFFLVLPLNVLFSLCLLYVQSDTSQHRLLNLDSLSITLHLTYDPKHPGPPSDSLIGFGVLLGTNLVGLIVIVARRDVVWCVAATWIVTSLWIARPKPPIISVRHNSRGILSAGAHGFNTDNRYSFHCSASARTHCVYDLRTVLFFASSQ